MPLDDWQFYVVTVAAAGGVWIIARPFIPRRRRKRGEKRVTLTVEGKKR